MTRPPFVPSSATAEVSGVDLDRSDSTHVLVANESSPIPDGQARQRPLNRQRRFHSVSWVGATASSSSSLLFSSPGVGVADPLTVRPSAISDTSPVLKASVTSVGDGEDKPLHASVVTMRQALAASTSDRHSNPLIRGINDKAGMHIGLLSSGSSAISTMSDIQMTTVSHRIPRAPSVESLFETTTLSASDQRYGSDNENIGDDDASHKPEPIVGAGVRQGLLDAEDIHALPTRPATKDEGLWRGVDIKSWMRLAAFVCSCLTGFGGHFAANVLGPIKDQVKGNLGISNSHFGLLQASLSIVPTVMPFLGGLFIDSFGTGTSSLIAISCIVVGQALVAYGAFAGLFAWMVLGFLLFGVGEGWMVVISETILVHFFHGRGLALMLGLQFAVGKSSSFLATGTAYHITEWTGFYGNVFLVATALCSLSWAANLGYLLLVRHLDQLAASVSAAMTSQGASDDPITTTTTITGAGPSFHYHMVTGTDPNSTATGTKSSPLHHPPHSLSPCDPNQTNEAIALRPLDAAQHSQRRPMLDAADSSPGEIGPWTSSDAATAHSEELVASSGHHSRETAAQPRSRRMLPRKRPPFDFGKVLRFTDIMWYFFFLCFLFGAVWIPFIHLSSNMIKVEYQLPDSQSAWLSSLIFALPIVLNPVTGVVLDRTGRLTWVVLGSAICLVLASGLMLLHPVALAVANGSSIQAAAPLFFFSLSLSLGPLAQVTSIPLMLPPASSHDAMGTALGIRRCVEHIGATLLDTLSGALQDLEPSHRYTYVLRLFLVLSVATCFAVVGWMYLDQKLLHRVLTEPKRHRPATLQRLKRQYAELGEDLGRHPFLCGPNRGEYDSNRRHYSGHDPPQQRRGWWAWLCGGLGLDWYRSQTRKRVYVAVSLGALVVAWVVFWCTGLRLYFHASSLPLTTKGTAAPVPPP
ncbi:hypothetical protein H4R35_005764 [Dimargaris xerosporica]|nr:hypothetical protein H4R35_005764 [Dimargaris xerosporica]